jgi:hypothetical protein
VTPIRASLQSVKGFGQDCNLLRVILLPFDAPRVSNGARESRRGPRSRVTPKATIFNRFFREARAGTGFRAVFAPGTSRRRPGVFPYSGQAAAGKVGARADCHALRFRKEPHARPGEPSGTVARARRSRAQPPAGLAHDRRGTPADHARPLSCTVTYPDSGHLRPTIPRPPATCFVGPTGLPAWCGTF